MDDLETRSQVQSYPRWTIARIERAREKAAASKRHAWYIGENPRTGVTQYMVFSQDPAKGNIPYWPTVLRTGSQGGYCYSLDGRCRVWIRCTCEAFATHGQPCWHAARVALRVEWDATKKARASRREALATAKGERNGCA